MRPIVSWARRCSRLTSATLWPLTRAMRTFVAFSEREEGGAKVKQLRWHFGHECMNCTHEKMQKTSALMKMFCTRIRRIKKQLLVARNHCTLQCFVATFVFQRNVIFFVDHGLDFILGAILWALVGRCRRRLVPCTIGTTTMILSQSEAVLLENAPKKTCLFSFSAEVLLSSSCWRHPYPPCRPRPRFSPTCWFPLKPECTPQRFNLTWGDARHSCEFRRSITRLLMAETVSSWSEISFSLGC